MSIAKSVFVLIDKFFQKLQNPSRMMKSLKDVCCTSDVVFDPSSTELTLDVYTDANNEGKRPVIFEIHGGGFVAGDKKYRECLCRYWARNTNAAVVNVNYGLGSQNICPRPMQQLVAAVNWVVDNADEYGFDLSRFVVTGDSAGAYYAAFLAVLQDSAQLQQLFECAPKAKFTATLLNCGLYDIPRAIDKNTALRRDICRQFFGVPFKQAPSSPYFKGTSVIDFVSDNFPPTLIIYSAHDIFCKGQAEAFVQVMRSHNVDVTPIVADRMMDNHTYSLTWTSKMAHETNDKMLEFLNNHFGQA